MLSLLLATLLLWVASAQAIETYEKVVLQLHWKHQFEFAGYYAAEYKGYFKEEGLNVQIKELSEKGSTIEEVLSGAAQYGTSPSGLILDRMHGNHWFSWQTTLNHHHWFFSPQQNIPT